MRENFRVMSHQRLASELGRSRFAIRMKTAELGLVKLPRLNLPEAGPGEKVCGKCRQARLVTDFHRNKQSPDGRTQRCKTCIQAYMQKWNNRPSAREQVTLAKYGLTEAQYDKISENQGDVCAICKQPPVGRYLGVDHDHFTGHVRGLLCQRCNTALGMLGDSVEGLTRALAYLERSVNGN